MAYMRKISSDKYWPVLIGPLPPPIPKGAIPKVRNS